MLNERYMDKLKTQWMTKTLKCSKVEDQQDGISISNIGGVFVVIVVGIGFAIVTLFFEYFWFKYYIKPHKSIAVVEFGKSNIISIAHPSTSNVDRTKKPVVAYNRKKTMSNIQIVGMNK